MHDGTCSTGRGTLLLLGPSLGLFTLFFPALAPLWGWVIGLTTLMTLFSIGYGLHLEATSFNTNGFDALDAWAQSLGAIAAGILLLILIWFWGPLGNLIAEMWLGIIGLGVISLLVGAPFSLYGQLPKNDDPWCKPRPKPGGP